MPVVIDEQYLPARLTAPPMTDAEFEAFCAEHPDLFIEVTAEGEILIMPPNFWLTGARNAHIGKQLTVWAQLTKDGFAIDSSGGFRLPNGARRSPDAAWISRERIAGVQSTGKGRSWGLCPEFVIELRSETDRLSVLRRKMREWVDNGAQLAWLIDPERRTVEVYRPGREMEVHSGIESITGTAPVQGFTLDLKPVWDPLS
ncbi:MAG: Uma2 family endonuclease [Bryobacteraceae bacterium]